jgi:hypothetical protein
MTDRLHLRARVGRELYREAESLARVMGVATNEFVVGAVRERVASLKKRGGKELQDTLSRMEGLQERLAADEASKR